MRGLLFATFPHRSHAVSARRALEPQHDPTELRALRLHDDGVDPIVAYELVGCRAQTEREKDVILRFLAVFGFFSVAGLAIDLFVIPVWAGLAATMLLGSLGVVVAALVLLTDRPKPLEVRFREIDDDLAGGGVLLTVPTDDARRAAALRAIDEHGGRTVIDA